MIKQHDLQEYTYQELRKMGERMDLTVRRSKSEMISEIMTAFLEYEEYKKDKIDRYTRHHQLGHKGKEGITYLVSDKNGHELAMKTFRKGKSSNTLKREYKLQKKAAKHGISPQVYDYDTVSKYIVMERMDVHFTEVIGKQKGILRKYQQERILEIFRTLDEIGIFHDDANLMNYMLKGKVVYIIDYGFAKEIDSKLIKKLGTDKPNMKLMLLGFVLKLKEQEIAREGYEVLLKHIDPKDRERFGL